MRKLGLAILTTAELLSASCGGSGNSGPVTTPTPPGQTQPPAVNVNDVGTTGSDPNFWQNGDMSFAEQTGRNTLGLQLTQRGAQVTGHFNIYGPDGGAGPLAGTVSGTSLTFNFSVGNQGQGCGNTASGIAEVGRSGMTGTFSGKRCNGQSYTNGRFTISLPPGYRTSAYQVGGKWTTNTPNALGVGVWTFDISETPVDVNASNVTGSVAVAGSPLNLGSGSLTGSVANTFPGPATVARMTVTFAGACPSNIVFNVGFSGDPAAADPQRMTGGVTGTTCSGSLPGGGLGLTRQ